MAITKFILPILLLILSPGIWAKEVNYTESIKKSHDLLKSKHSAETIKLKKLIKNSDTVNPEEFSLEFKKINFKIYSDLAMLLKTSKKNLPETHPHRKLLSIYRENLSQLEYQESKVEKVYELIQRHFKNIEESKYNGQWRFYIDYLSWQYKKDITGPDSVYELLITNTGYCPGINRAWENKRFSFSIDACFILASGEVNSLDQSSITFEQSAVGTMGFKAALTAGAFVSSSGAEIGLKLPALIYTQELGQPSDGDYKIEQGTIFRPMLGIYSRWPLGNFFFQTEFSKQLLEDQTLWALGLGYKF